MTDYTRARDAARRFGFARPRPKMPVLPETEDVHPPLAVVDRLGIHPGMRVALVGVEDEALANLVSDRTTKCTTMVPREPVDIVIFQADGTFDLKRVPDLCRAVARGGSLWVLWPRGQEHIKQSHVRRAGIAAGLVDVKVAGLSERLSGLQFVRATAVR